MVTTIEAAKRLGITRVRIGVLIRAGRLPAVKVGRDWVLDEKDIASFAKQDRTPGRPRKGK
jgi:excisionase family DNA binding protein